MKEKDNVKMNYIVEEEDNVTEREREKERDK